MDWDETLREMGVETTLTEEDARAAASKAREELIDAVESFPGKEDEDALARWVLQRSHILANEVTIDAYCAGIRPYQLISGVLAQILLLEDSWDVMQAGIASALGRRAEERVCKHEWDSPQMRLMEEGSHFFQTCSRCGHERRV